MNRKIFTMIHLLGEHFDFTRTVVRLVDNTRQNVEYSHYRLERPLLKSIPPLFICI